MTNHVPPELQRLETQTGASWAGYNEVDINLDVAQRVARLLERKGLLVDVLPTTIPAGYVADAFVALHADSDGVGEKSGSRSPTLSVADRTRASSKAISPLRTRLRRASQSKQRSLGT